MRRGAPCERGRAQSAVLRGSESEIQALVRAGMSKRLREASEKC